MADGPPFRLVTKSPSERYKYHTKVDGIALVTTRWEGPPRPSGVRSRRPFCSGWTRWSS